MSEQEPTDVKPDVKPGGEPCAQRAEPARFTAWQWKTFQRARKRWVRRTTVATGALVLAEVACALAWSAWADALTAPLPKVPGP